MFSKTKNEPVPGKFLKSRHRRFARSYRSMEPQKLDPRYQAQFLKRKEVCHDRCGWKSLRPIWPMWPIGHIGQMEKYSTKHEVCAADGQLAITFDIHSVV